MRSLLHILLFGLFSMFYAVQASAFSVWTAPLEEPDLNDEEENDLWGWLSLSEAASADLFTQDLSGALPEASVCRNSELTQQLKSGSKPQSIVEIVAPIELLFAADITSARKASAFRISDGADEDSLFDAPTLDDEQLQDARGGFALPDGTEIALAVLVSTSLNGTRLLQTELHINRSNVTASVTDANGDVHSSEIHDALRTNAELSGLSIQHEIGNRISSVVINSGNDRMIDTQISVNLVLDNVQPLSIGSLGYRIQSLSVDAGIWRAMGG